MASPFPDPSRAQGVDAAPAFLEPMTSRPTRMAQLALGQRQARPTLAAVALAWLVGTLVASHAGIAAQAAPQLDDATRSLLVQTAEAAAALDAYNARCRGDISGRHQDDLNKVLVGRLRMTLLAVQDDLFPEKSYRAAQKRLDQDFVDRLRDAGGCQGAKDTGMPDELRTTYNDLMKQVRALP